MRAASTILLSSALLLVPAAFAEEAAHEHAAGPALAPLLFSAINLAIFLWILARFAMPQVRRFVHQRRNQIVQAMEEAAAAKAEAQQLRAQWETALAQFDQKMEELRAQARHDAERERDRIVVEARKAADGIRRDAERAAAYEVRRMQEQLRAELVRHAVRLAAETARAQLTADDQQRFITEFLNQVGT